MDALTSDLSSREEEWLERARRDFRFFCAHLSIKIKDEQHDGDASSLTGPFIWRPAQVVVWYWMCAQMRRGVPVELVILKARQFGISTFFCAWLFWNMWRTMNVRCMISVKSKGTTMRAFSETMNRFYESLPPGFRPALRSAGSRRLSAEEIYFEDRKSGGYYIAADIPDAARGDAYDHALCTEVGSYARAKDFFGEFTPAMGRRRNTTRVLESTAAPGEFRTRYLRAKERGSAPFLPWSAAPEMYARKLIADRKGNRTIYRDAETENIFKLSDADRKEMAFLSRQHEQINKIIGVEILQPVTIEQMAWWHYTCDEEHDGDEEWMNQEYPRDDKSAFEKSVVSAFKVCLGAVRESVESAPKAERGVLECRDDLEELSIDTHEIEFVEVLREYASWQERVPGIEIYDKPQLGYIYTIGVDVADDIGTVQDEDDAAFSVISVYCCNTRRQVAEWRGSIDPHALGDEVAKVGYYYNTAMVCVEYNNMGISTIDRLTKYLMYPNRFKWMIIDEAGRLHPRKEMWWTNQHNKQLMIGSFRNAVRTGLYVAQSAGLYEEMMGYQHYEGYYEPGPGCFADRIIAAALSWACVSTQEDPEMLALVFGSKYQEREPRHSPESAMGQAARGIARVTANPFERPSRLLPVEFAKPGEDDMQSVQESWIFQGVEEWA